MHLFYILSFLDSILIETEYSTDLFVESLTRHVNLEEPMITLVTGIKLRCLQMQSHLYTLHNFITLHIVIFTVLILNQFTLIYCFVCHLNGHTRSNLQHNFAKGCIISLDSICMISIEIKLII